MKTIRPVVLCILDGWGLRSDVTGNAVALAPTPNFDRIMRECTNNTLTTFGPDVGLPAGQMGNSEVGHMNIGAGRVVQMDLTRINNAIAQGNLMHNPAMQRIVETVADSKKTVHLCGVMSDGGVHSHLDHMIHVSNALTSARCRVALHAFSDGRDVAPKSALGYAKVLQDSLLGDVRVATLGGRYFALDRDKRWKRVKRAYDAIVHGIGETAGSFPDAIEAQYAKGLSDEFFEPTVIDGYTGIEEGDALLFLNFRADRARQILAAIGDPDFDDFQTGVRPQLALMSGFTRYSTSHRAYMECIFQEEDITNTLGLWVAGKGLRQFRVAETEKYPHVTYFFNCGHEIPLDGEDWYLAPSPDVATYDLQPQMSSLEVTENLAGAISSGKYDLIVVNYANPDMVGHTGDLQAAITACASVDQCLGTVLSTLEMAGGAMLLCADHGNCETMIDPQTGGPHTAHTTNQVPVALIGAPKDAKLRGGGRLADIAPTLLELMGLDAPPEMTGTSLIIDGGQTQVFG